ncbi:MAG: hypothetical protein KDD03_06085 [Gelidibacter sp.]|nr:hypothetical protein [Gelidibacter sp.]
MKNFKITLENGTSITKLDITKAKAIDFANDVRFNSKKLKFKITIASNKDVEKEKERLAEIRAEYDDICRYNTKVDRYNSAISKATNHHEFMNAANHLR